MGNVKSNISMQDQFSPALMHMVASLNLVITEFQKMKTASKDAVDTKHLLRATEELGRAQMIIKGNQAAIHQETTAQNQLKTEMIRSVNEQRNMNSEFSKGAQKSNEMVGNIKRMVGAYVSLRTLQAGMNATDQNAGFTARLNLINDGLQSQAELQKRIFESANRARAEYSATVSTVAKLGLLAGDAFKSNGEIINFTELMNKAFTISGASTQEKTAAMYQLTQAMAAGKLQGDEFRSIMENAPMLANAIAQYTGKSKGDLKDLSREGTITADVIKAALFTAAEDINKKYETMPKKFSDIGTQMKNEAVMMFQDTMSKVNAFLNTPVGEQFLKNFITDLQVAKFHVDAMVQGSIRLTTVITENWGAISPIVWGAVDAMVAYHVATKTAAMMTGIATFSQGAYNMMMSLYAIHTGKATAVQGAFNVALMGNPIGLIAGALSLVIGGYIAWKVHTEGLMVTTLKLKNGMLSFVEGVQLGWMKMNTSWANTWDQMMIDARNTTDGIQDKVDSMKVNILNMMGDLTNKSRDTLNGFIETLNKIPGVSIPTLEHLTIHTEYAAQKEAEKQARANERNKFINETQNKMQRRSDVLAAKEFEISARRLRRLKEIELEKQRNREEQQRQNDTSNYQGNYETDAFKSMSKDTSKISEDLTYIKNLAAVKAVNKFGMGDLILKVDNSFGDIHQKSDVFGVIDAMTEQFREQMTTSLEGVLNDV